MSGLPERAGSRARWIIGRGAARRAINDAPRSSSSAAAKMDSGKKDAPTITPAVVVDEDDKVGRGEEKSPESQSETTGLLKPPDAGGNLPRSPSSEAVQKTRRLLSSSRSELRESDVEDNNNEQISDDELLFNQRSVFCQMDLLCDFEDGDVAWKEISRWIKYEEKVDSGDHWSKPHVSTLPLHAITTLRSSIADGSCLVCMDLPVDDGITTKQVAALMVEKLKSEQRLDDDQAQQLQDILMRPHKHKHRKIVPKSAQDGVDQSATSPPGSPSTGLIGSTPEPKKGRRFMPRKRKGKEVADALTSFPVGANPNAMEDYKSNKRLEKKLPKGTEAASILIGQVPFLKEPIMALYRLSQAKILSDWCEIATETRFVFLALGPKSRGSTVWELSERGRAMAVLLGDKIFCEVAYVARSPDHLTDGIDEFIDDVTVLPPSIWDPTTRMEPPQKTISMEKIHSRLDLTSRWAKEPTSPAVGHGEGSDEGLRRTGKFFGGMIDDVKRRYRLFKSDILDGLNPQCLASIIFLYFACITPIVTFGGLMSQKTGQYLGTMEMLLSGAICGTVYAVFSGQPLTIIGATGPLLIFESIIYQLCDSNGIAFMPLRFWVGLWLAVILLVIVAFDLSFLVRYITRFTEESFAVLISIIFIYEAFSKVIAIYGDYPVDRGYVPGRHNVRPCLCVRPTLDQMSLNESAHNMTALLASELNGTLTVDGESYQWNDDHGRYLDAGFSTAFSGNWSRLDDDCYTAQNKVFVGDGCLLPDDCLARHWVLDGDGCDSLHVPDVFFLSLILFLGTFGLAMFCRFFRSTGYFPSWVRSIIGDFAVLLSVIAFSLLDLYFDINTPKLYVPSEFKPTSDNRGWFINPMAVTHWWLVVVAAIPALLATILVFLDQQITAVIVNRSEHKLKKGFGYHLDLFVLALLIIVCSLLGLPWFVAATVRSVTHVRSLIKYSDVSAPGERPEMLGVREQRVTGIVIHLMIGFSTLLTVVLQFIPMPVLYGVFLYMGVTSLGGVQYVQRVLLLLMPAKYQPDYVYIRHVETSRIHSFTAIQLVCSVVMWNIKSIKSTSIIFPLMLMALIGIRKLMDYVYTQQDLYWLDHLLPEDDRRKAEDEGNKLECGVQLIAPQKRPVADVRRRSVVLVNAKGKSILAKKHSLQA